MVPRNLLLLLSNDQKKNSEVENGLTQRGYSVFRVGSQEEAVRKMRTKSVDMLICDTSFIKGEQKSFSEFIQANGERFLPVILVAAEMQDEDKELFKTFPGVRAMVPQPLDLSQLEKLVAGNLPEESSIPGLEPDDDSDKPLYDRKDNISIDIGVFVTQNGAAPFRVNLVEYAEGTVLLDVGTQAFKKDELLSVSIKSTGPTGESQVEFQGKVLNIEDVEDGSTRLVTVDSSQVGAEFTKQIVGQVTRRQSELLKFIRDTQE
jgi:DNA-binding response OmpR family regulator